MFSEGWGEGDPDDVPLGCRAPNLCGLWFFTSYHEKFHKQSVEKVLPKISASVVQSLMSC